MHKQEMRVYLDTNVFDHILNHKGGITPRNVDQFFSLLRSGDVIVPVSLPVLGEMVDAFPNDPENAQGMLKLFRRISPSSRAVIKDAGDLIFEEIRAFIEGRKNANSFVEERQARIVHNMLSQSDWYAEIEDYVKIDFKQKEQFLSWALQIRLRH